ncbi:MAG TPA: acylneuraminate cytidylyltransferase family protein [Tessaracoccus flavescens]|uniref:Acylneuraminate cytidylyltransferase family protein n=1 Tax=Tessaracoccus flavescens TaxID=399497 RepID=A0A921JQM3_9ACTN|nr:acylneuraminate cytidylyltransferase family protein [Tessaracoccus flavescens]
MSMLAVIPARGWSKGIPRKNLLPVGGKPLIVWTIEQALAVPGLRVAVSTEDNEIAEVAERAGAWVIRRPLELAQDETPTEPVVLHAIEECTAGYGRPDAVMLLQATSPVRRTGTLERAVAEFEASGHDSLVGVVPNPPFLWSVDGGDAVAHWDWENRRRRQDMTPEQLRYRETGSVYVTRTEIYERLNNRMGGRIGLFIMDEAEGVDIDTFHDLSLAESLLTASPAD